MITIRKAVREDVKRLSDIQKSAFLPIFIRYHDVGNPCLYGTDIDSRENLIACRCTVEETAREIGADSLGYLPVSRLAELIGSHGFCDACFTGNYPTAVPDSGQKCRFERPLSEREPK